MKKLICKIFGHKEKQMCEGSFVSACMRCGELSDYTLFIEERFFRE